MIIEFCRVFFGSIPEDFGNRGESTITKLPVRIKERQKHHNNKTRRVEWRCFDFFLRIRNRGMATGILPRELAFETKPRFLLRKKIHITVIRFTVVWSFLWSFCHCLFLIGNFVMVDSPWFPKSSGIDPKKTLEFCGFSRCVTGARPSGPLI